MLSSRPNLKLGMKIESILERAIRTTALGNDIFLKNFYK